MAAAGRAGIEIREWRIDPETGICSGDDLEDLLDETVRLVCFPALLERGGEINPVVEITALAHAAGAFVCVDGVSYAPHGFADVGDLGPDIYLFSAYKTYGPHQGIMVIRRALGNLLPNQAHYFNGDVFTSGSPRRGRIMRRSRPARAWRIISTPCRPSQVGGRCAARGARRA